MAKIPLTPGSSITTESTPSLRELRTPLTYVEITQGTKGEVRFSVRVHDDDPQKALDQSKAAFANLCSTFNGGPIS